MRFDNNAYFTRTPSVAGNRKTWTWSGWVKRGAIDAVSVLYGVPTNSNVHDRIEFLSDGRLRILYDDSNTGTAGGSATVAKFRDPASWYHFVIAIDTTQASEADRSKYYVNGVLQDTTSSNSGIPQNHEWQINNSTAQRIASWSAGGSSNYFNGYLAEVNFVDGQALDPTDFGETKSGVWIPKKYTGSYGTNGFYLDFATRATDPIDASGNGNNWGSVNVVSTDWMLDSPTNNFGVLNPLANSGGTLSEGNLKLTGASSAWGTGLSTIAVSSGKWYAEVVPTSGSTTQGIMFGISNYITAPSNYIGSASTSYGYYGFDGSLNTSGSVTSSWGATVADNDIVGIALDMDAGTLKLYKNNVQQGTTITGLSGLFYIGFSCYGTATANINFGQDSSFAGTKTAQGNTDANGIGDFYYAPPADHLALCSANLPDTAIDPVKDDIPADYFNTVLYTGNGSDNLAITGVGFQPDFTWIKSRSAAYSHNVYDNVRGVSKRLQPNLTNAESSPISGVKSFDADGFTLGNDTNDTNFTSGVTYVSWNWKAGGTAVANTDGTITSTVSANQKAGFSIVKVDSLPASTLSTFGHGLGVKPDLIILKSRNNTTNWDVYHSSLTPDGERKIYLNDASAEIDSGFMGDTPPTSSVISFNPGGSTSNHIAYCFHSVEGFSKFGSYTGNGSTDGPFVYTGFRPAFVMLKSASTGNTDWTQYDSARETYNTVDQYLIPNKSNAEASPSGEALDLTSNGFKVRGSWVGMNSGTIIYMAFAEMPFKYANAR